MRFTSGFLLAVSIVFMPMLSLATGNSEGIVAVGMTSREVQEELDGLIGPKHTLKKENTDVGGGVVETWHVEFPNGEGIIIWFDKWGKVEAWSDH